MRIIAAILMLMIGLSSVQAMQTCQCEAKSYKENCGISSSKKWCYVKGGANNDACDRSARFDLQNLSIEELSKRITELPLPDDGYLELENGRAVIRCKLVEETHARIDEARISEKINKALVTISNSSGQEKQGVLITREGDVIADTDALTLDNMGDQYEIIDSEGEILYQRIHGVSLSDLGIQEKSIEERLTILSYERDEMNTNDQYYNYTDINTLQINSGDDIFIPSRYDKSLIRAKVITRSDNNFIIKLNSQSKIDELANRAPLFNSNAKLIGFLTGDDEEEIIESTATGNLKWSQSLKAIAIDRATAIASNNKNIHREDLLGVKTSDIENYNGVRITQVLKNSPAWQACLQQGDVIDYITKKDFDKKIANSATGDMIPLTMWAWDKDENKYYRDSQKLYIKLSGNYKPNEDNAAATNTRYDNCTDKNKIFYFMNR